MSEVPAWLQQLDTDKLLLVKKCIEGHGSKDDLDKMTELVVELLIEKHEASIAELTAADEIAKAKIPQHVQQDNDILMNEARSMLAQAAQQVEQAAVEQPAVPAQAYPSQSIEARMQGLDPQDPTFGQEAAGTAPVADFPDGDVREGDADVEASEGATGFGETAAGSDEESEASVVAPTDPMPDVPVPGVPTGDVASDESEGEPDQPVNDDTPVDLSKVTYFQTDDVRSATPEDKSNLNG